MTKMSFHFTLGAMLLALSVPAQAQQVNKVFRIGYLSNATPTLDIARPEAIRQRLRELGYTEGKNIVFEYRYGEGNRDRAPKLAAELVALNCDVIIVAGGFSWVRSVMDATKTVPIVMTGGGVDPVEGGLVNSLARPGGNVTGMANLGSELGGKRLELLKETVARVSRVAVFYELANPSDVSQVKEELPPVARALKLTLQPWEIRGADDFEKGFSAMSKQRSEAIFVTGGGGLIRAYSKRITDFALKNRLPSMFARSFEVESGGLMSYGSDNEEGFRQAAWYVDRILKGTKPADLPVQQPTKFEFVINLKTAKQIGLTIPPDLLARATKIIK